MNIIAIDSLVYDFVDLGLTYLECIPRSEIAGF